MSIWASVGRCSVGSMDICSNTRLLLYCHHICQRGDSGRRLEDRRVRGLGGGHSPRPRPCPWLLLTRLPDTASTITSWQLHQLSARCSPLPSVPRPLCGHCPCPALALHRRTNIPSCSPPARTIADPGPDIGVVLYSLAVTGSFKSKLHYKLSNISREGPLIDYM